MPAIRADIAAAARVIAKQNSRLDKILLKLEAAAILPMELSVNPSILYTKRSNMDKMLKITDKTRDSSMLYAAKLKTKLFLVLPIFKI